MDPYWRLYKNDRLLLLYPWPTAQLPNQDVSRDDEQTQYWCCPDTIFFVLLYRLWADNVHSVTYYTSCCLLLAQSVHNRTQILCLGISHLFLKRDELGQGQTRKKGTFALSAIRTYCWINVLWAIRTNCWINVLCAIRTHCWINVLSAGGFWFTLATFHPVTLYLSTAVQEYCCKFFSLNLPFAPLFFHLIMFCTHNLPCYKYQGAWKHDR